MIAPPKKISIVLLALSLPHTVSAAGGSESGEAIQLFQPSKADKIRLNNKINQIDEYVWEEERLEEARKRLRELERQKAYTREGEEKLGIPPSVIRDQRELQDQAIKAMNEPLVESQCQIKTINYDPSAPKPIRLPVATKSPAHLIFQDSTGQVWPIAGHTQGDSSTFTAKIATEQNHIYEVSVKKPYGTATNNLILKDYAQPIVIRLVGDEVDNYCVLNVRMPMPGPNAQSKPVVLSDAGYGGGDDDYMFDLAVNTIPNGAREIPIHGLTDAGRAWIIDDRLYVRSRYWMESPPRAQIQDSSGIYVYRIEDPTTVTGSLRTPDGESVRITFGD